MTTTATKKKSASKVSTVKVNATATASAAPATAASAASAAVTASSPMADRVTQAMSYVKMAMAILALNPPALTVAQRRRMAKLRKGGGDIMPLLARLATEWSVEIRTQPTAAMTAAMQLASELDPLVTTLSGATQETQDTSFQAESDAWATASALYSVLKRMSKKDPKLAAQLAPAVDFFKFRRPVASGQPATPAKPGKEAKRKAKEVAQAEEVVAHAGEASAGAAPPATSAPTAPATSGAIPTTAASGHA